MIAAAQDVICLVDYSKFHHVAFAPFCPLHKIHTIITDDRIPASEQESLRSRGVRVHVV